MYFIIVWSDVAKPIFKSINSSRAHSYLMFKFHREVEIKNASNKGKTNEEKKKLISICYIYGNKKETQISDSFLHIHRAKDGEKEMNSKHIV